MTKSTVTKTWIGGLVTFAGGIVVALFGVLLMLAYGGTFTQVAGNPNQYDFNPNLNAFFWMTIMFMTIGGLITLAGSIVQLVAWIGGLVNSYWLPEKTWFAVLLVGGVLAFFFAPIGFAAMLAYVIAAPDGTPYRRPHEAIAPQPTTLAPTS